MTRWHHRIHRSSIYVTTGRSSHVPHPTRLSTSDMTSPEEVAFYSKLFNIRTREAPGRLRQPPSPGRQLGKLVLIENPGHGGSINHLGVEVESSDKVPPKFGRLTEEGLFPRRDGHHVLLRYPNKVWVTGPAGEKEWEVYTVLARRRHLRRGRRCRASCC